MRKGILSKTAIFCLVGALAACSVRHPKAVVYQVPAAPDRVTDTPNRIPAAIAPPARLSSAISDSITQKSLSYTTLSLKAKANFHLEQNDQDVTLTIRIQHNEKIWISASAIAGIEVARMLITPDSVKMMNRVDKQYLKKPFSYLADVAGSDLRFSTLEALVTGNPLPELLEGSPVASVEQERRIVRSMVGKATFSALFTAGWNLLQSTAQKDDTQLVAAYGDFDQGDVPNFPSAVTISTTGSRPVRLIMNYSKIVINEPVETSFAVPNRFTLIN